MTHIEKRNLIKHYFELKYLITKRIIKEDIGIHPYLGFLLLLLAFVFGSYIIFARIPYPAWCYALIGIMTMLQQGSTQKQQLLKPILARNYVKVRLIENLMFSFPFALFLSIKGEFYTPIALLLLSLILVFYERKKIHKPVIPTPFWKWPFEAIVGFRTTWFLILILYFVLVKAIDVSNANLGLVAYGLLNLVCSLFSLIKLEPVYFIWIHDGSPQKFLSEKIKNSLITASILCVPWGILLSIAFPSQALTLFIVQIISLLAGLTFVLIKYSMYPRKLDLLQAIPLLVSLFFAPMLIIMPFIYYNKAIRQLKKLHFFDPHFTKHPQASRNE